jgi:hypothetical protein
LFLDALKCPTEQQNWTQKELVNSEPHVL